MLLDGSPLDIIILQKKDSKEENQELLDLNFKELWYFPYGFKMNVNQNGLIG